VSDQHRRNDKCDQRCHSLIELDNCVRRHSDSTPTKNARERLPGTPRDHQRGHPGDRKENQVGSALNRIAHLQNQYSWRPRLLANLSR
jgi:hypothetical protein